MAASVPARETDRRGVWRWHHGKVIWCVVKEYASKAQIGNLAPHDLRRTCARLCYLADGELE
jgi:integrase